MASDPFQLPPKPRHGRAENNGLRRDKFRSKVP